MRRALFFVVGLLLSLAPTADASKLHLIAPSITNFSSDGSRFVTWQVTKRSPIVVFDTRTDHRGQFALPGCEPLDEGRSPGDGLRAANGRFLVVCNNTENLLDVRTGLVTTLPAGTGDGPSWQVVGTRYVEGWDGKDKCRQTALERKRELGCVALYDIATGVVTVRPHSGQADLDRPGAPPICARLQAELTYEYAGYVFSDERAGYSNGLLAEAGGKAMRIIPCRGSATMLRARGESRDIELASRLLTWDNAHPLSDFEGDLSNPGFRHGLLESYRLASGRRESFALPALRLVSGQQEHPLVHLVSGYSTHTATSVFWIGVRTLAFGEAGSTVGTSAVYAAKL